MKIKKGDLVKVIAGNKKNKGRTGRVLEVFTKSDRVKIEGIAEIKRHVKPQVDPRNKEGGIIADLGTVHVSNVMLVSDAVDRPVRTGFLVNADGKKIRVARGRSVKPVAV